MKQINIEQYVVGMVQTNCYIAVNSITKEAVIIDPADQAELLEKKITEKGVKPVAILLTHGHFDHILAAEELAGSYKIPVYAHGDECEILKTPSLNLSTMSHREVKMEPDVILKDNQEIELAGFQIRVLHTPGHTKGSVCYYMEEEEVLFSGDTLFQQSVGRTDFPTGSSVEIVRSIKEKLAILPDSVQVYPGHEGITSIGHEKKFNPFIA
ncbi:MBL fold metallo-hydrolase [Anaerosacchariphilus polymeriproducens]|uniref:MBL fold metallo-hydrolase n=1 Tax=Anaerosacchariphilus polymeriproducens TaxID=1812858 RepID=A0A371AWI4_9FIRM|nr:MBL fold metallo-hydrolase [Anaerosacchariphilus polymeriproducens]RDU23945.1 MBL fold metallo-hydrolase [Anaerosacchariphilus polymeriproducens]